MRTISVAPLITLRDDARSKDPQLRVTYPAGEGSYPVVVLSHHAGGTKDGYAPLAAIRGGEGNPLPVT